MAVLSATSASRAEADYSPNCEVYFDAQGGLLVASVRATRSIISGERLQLHNPEEEEQEEWEDESNGSKSDGKMANEGESNDEGNEEGDKEEKGWEEEGRDSGDEARPHSKRPRLVSAKNH